MIVHPVFCPDTRMWHWDEFRAPSLAALQRQLGPQVTIKDYYPLTRPIAAAFLERVLPPTLQPFTVLRQVRAGAGKPVKPRASVDRGTARADDKPKIRIDREIVKSMWNAGHSLAEIAERTGSTTQSISATVVAMRREGHCVPRRPRHHQFTKKETHHA